MNEVGRSAPSKVRTPQKSAPVKKKARTPRAKTAKPAAKGDAVKLSGEKPAAGKSPIDFSKSFDAKKPMELKDGKSLKRGSENHDQVRQMQEKLIAGGAKITADGKFGPETEKAVKEFQKTNELKLHDGIVGPETLAKLNGAGAAPKGNEAPAKVNEVKGNEAPAKGAEAPAKAAGTPSSMQGAMDKAAQGEKTSLGKLHTLQDARTDGKSTYFKAGASIDVDGSGPSHGDPHKQNQTSLSLKGGGYPNADKVPYFVLPPGAAKKMGAKVGDLGMIRYNGKMTPAVFADSGPKNRIGEISRNAAQKLGIPDSPISGGTGKGVEYQVFPGSRGPKRPSAADLTPEALQKRVDELLAAQKQ